MTWDAELAKLFKERNNKPFSGFVIGVVKSAKPLIISIEDGQVLLDEDDLYTLQSLVSMAFTSITFEVPLLHSSVIAPQTKTDFRALAVMKPFEIGEMVGLLPDKYEQQYLIIDRIKKGGV